MKIKALTLFLTIFIIGIAQATAADYIEILGAKPDLLFIVVVFFALCRESGEGLKTAILAGLFEDVTSAFAFASTAFGFCLCALFLNRYGSHFYKQKIPTQILLCGFLYLITNFFILFFNYLMSKNLYASFMVYWWIIFKAAIYTGLVSPFVFFVLSKIFKVRLEYA